MYEKGPTLTIARTSAIFFASLRALPCFSCSQPHLRRALRGNPYSPPNPRRALPVFSCKPPNPSCALRGFSCSPPNPIRALPLIPCRGSISCKDLGEVHVERSAECPFRRALPPFFCTQACTSPVSLHEFAAMQGFGGSARQDARIWGKCTSPCKNKGEAHVPVRESRGSARHRAGIEGKCTSPCKNKREVHVAFLMDAREVQRSRLRAGLPARESRSGQPVCSPPGSVRLGGRSGRHFNWINGGV